MVASNLIPPPIQKRNQNQAPLSASQESLWFLHRLAPDSPAYNVIYLFRMLGGVNQQVLERSLNEIVRRHEILRTAYPIDKEGKPFQVVKPFESFKLLCLDYSSSKADKKEQTLHDYAMEHGSEPFDLENGPVTRFALLHVGSEEDYLFFAIHHIASDDWSRRVFVDDLLQFYKAYQAGQKTNIVSLPIQYTDYALWQKEWVSGETRTLLVQHWKSVLSGELPILALSTDHPRRVNQASHGFRYNFELSPSLSARIKEFCRNERLTPTFVLIAAYALLLTRYTGQEDIIIGCPFANRPRSEQDSLIGNFVNTLPIRLNLAGNPTVRDLLKQVRNVVLDASTWKDLPFETLVAELAPQRVWGRTPIYQAMVNILNVPKRQNSIPELEVDLFLREQTMADFDISLEFFDTSNLFSASLFYNMDLFDTATILRMASHYQNTLKEMLGKPDRPLSDLDMLSSVEKQQILVDWNNTARSYQDYRGLHEIVEEQARKQPDAIAVVFERQQLTYRQLNSLSNRLARRLQQYRIGPEKLVAISMDRSAEIIIAILGTFKAGGAYLPLDPSLPLERKKLILEETHAEVILVNHGHEKSLPEMKAEVIQLNEGWDDSAPRDDSNPANLATPDNLAYIIYTSGSTGRPKGVLLSQRGLVNLAEAQREVFDALPGDRVLQFSSLNFDASIFEIAMALGAGAAIVLAPKESILPGTGLFSFMEKFSITHLTIPPSSFINVPVGNLPALKTLSFAGEVCTSELVERWKKVPNLFNLYGPTEATVWASTARIRLDGGKPSIGSPVPNTKIYILDRNLTPVPQGVAGELVIGGIGVARGYLQRDDLTAEHFIPSPFTGQNEMRLYRSGDLARWLPDGSIEFLGRIDNQVKIRGYRIELGEIENTIRQYDGVRQALVVVRENLPGDKRLVAYLLTASNSVQDEGKLRGFLREKLPDYMVPSSFVPIDTFPLTPSGKIDLKALSDPETTISNKYIPPKTNEEIQLLKVWEAVLGISPISVEDDFFDIGGNSLLAIRLCLDIENKLNVNLPIVELFRFPTIRQLAEKLNTKPRNAALVPLQHVDRNKPIPVSFAQQSLWLQYQLEGRSNTYNLPFAYRLEGELNIAALEKSLRYLITRHDALRTSFKLIDGKPCQVIAENVKFKLEVHASDGETAEKELLAWASEPFSLEQAPLMRAHLWKNPLNKYRLLFSFHHIIFDGWSKGVLERELMEVFSQYAAGREPCLPALESDYADYAAWQRSWLGEDELEQQLTYWQEHLKGAPELLDLPTDHPRLAARTYRGSKVHLDLGPALVDKLRELSRREDVTLSMLLNAAYAILLGRYSHQDIVVIGFPVANRQRKELEGIMGFFVNMLPLLIDLNGNPGVTELLQRVRQGSIDAYAHQDMPYEKIVEGLQIHRNPGVNPVFQVVSDFVNTPSQKFRLGEFDVQPEFVEIGSAKFDLSLLVKEQGKKLSLELGYNVDLFESATVQRMLTHFKVVLEWMTSDQINGICEFEPFTYAERQQLLVEWNNTRMEYPRWSCLHELFEAQVIRTPDATGIVFENEHITYRDLNVRANRLANHLRQLGVGPEVMVGLYIDHSVNAIIGILGILKASGVYLPLASDLPPDRLAFYLADARPLVILTLDKLQGKLSKNTFQLVCLDSDRDLLAGESEENPACSAKPENLACVIYTSGSTGKPKGVMLTHRAFCNNLHYYLTTYQPRSTDRVIQHMSLSFDYSIWEIFITLVSGACLVVADQHKKSDVNYLARLIEEQGITIAGFVPSHLDVFLESPSINNHLRLIFSGGEVLTPELQKRFFEKYSAKLINGYGPTETTIDVCHWICKNDDTHDEVPIGRPIGNTQLYVLDQRLHPVPIGVPGELYIGGDCLARGYLNQPELTDKMFISNPFSNELTAKLYKTGDLVRYLSDGEIVFLGRMDNQVKLRGYRIELGEIEAAIGQYQGIQKAFVMVWDSRPGDKRLVAYITLASGITLDVDKLRGFLREKLPGYMVPSAFMQIDAFPRTSSGKMDRQALPRPKKGADADSYQAPRNDTETRLVSIWKEVLGIEKVGIRDNFFELGGHSLLAVRLFARIQEEFGLSMPLQMLFKKGTIEALADALTHIDDSSFLPGITPIRSEGSKTPMFIISPQLLMRELAFTLATGRPVYGLTPVENGKEVYRRSVQDTAIIFYHNLVDFYPQGPYLLLGHSGRGLFTLELARVLLQNGKDVAFLGLLDTYPLKKVSPVSQLNFHTNNLLHKNIPEILKYIENSLRRFSTRWWIKTLNSKTVERYQKEGRVPVQEVMDHLMRAYAPKPYPGQVTLFSIANHLSEGNEDPMKRWANTFMGKLDIVTVHGDHVSMLQQPHVVELAEKIDALLPPD